MLPIQQTADAETMVHTDQNDTARTHTADRDFGHAGLHETVNRTIMISAHDNSFSPSHVSVHRGETVNIVVNNKGKFPHELVLGPRELQKEHEMEMNGRQHDEISGHHSGKGNGIVVGPGETRQLTWTFSTDLEQIQFACHVPGHYESGMFGSIEIRDSHNHQEQRMK